MTLHLQAQVGGESSYQTLEVTSNARSAALAGSTVSLGDGDLSQFWENPATLDSVGSGSVFLNINPFFAGINFFSGSYAFEWKKLPLAASLQYFDFGSFETRDATGASNGNFNAQDYSVSLGTAHRVGPFSLGARLTVLHSSIERFGSTTLAGDIGGIFRISPNWSFGMVFGNMGGRISNYNELARPDLPFAVSLGTTFKPQYMPLRFTITSPNLVEKNVVATTSSEGRSNEQLEKVLRRINFGVEVLLSKHFQVLVGYSHKRKQELKLTSGGAGAGWSYGLMLAIKQFTLRYSRAIYHAAGGTSFISIQTNLRDFKKIL